MNKLGDFNLDVKVSSKGAQPIDEIFICFACTPVTCHASCEHGSTFYSDCCQVVQETNQTVSIVGE